MIFLGKPGQNRVIPVFQIIKKSVSSKCHYPPHIYSSFPANRVGGPEDAGEHAGQPGKDLRVDVPGDEELHRLDLAAAPRGNLAMQFYYRIIVAYDLLYGVTMVIAYLGWVHSDF